MHVVRTSSVLAVFLLVVATSLSSGGRAAPQEHFLDYSEDNYKTAFMSGNLTVAVTRDWPRMVFQHTLDLFSPTFVVGSPVFYLFNDSNQDGIFCLSETLYTGYLDWNHVSWIVSPVVFENDTLSGEHALLNMSTSVSLYEGLENQTVKIHNWANVTFWFSITEKSVNYSNDLGTYMVRGRTDMRMNFSLKIEKHVNASGIALEQSLQGGAGTFMFLLKEKDPNADVVYTAISSRVDETVYGLNFTHRFLETSSPSQKISFAKEDNTVQAYYCLSSEPTNGSGEASSRVPMNLSYYTTGSGLMLHTAYFINNETDLLMHDVSIGIDESGFIGSVTDWMKEHLYLILALVLVVVVIVGVVAFIVIRASAALVKAAREQDEREEKKIQ